MKVKLLNDGGFTGLKSVSFPVIVDAECNYSLDVVHVSFENIMSLPGAFFSKDDNSYGESYVFMGKEFEVVK